MEDSLIELYESGNTELCYSLMDSQGIEYLELDINKYINKHINDNKINEIYSMRRAWWDFKNLRRFNNPIEYTLVVYVGRNVNAVPVIKQLIDTSKVYNFTHFEVSIYEGSNAINYYDFLKKIKLPHLIPKIGMDLMGDDCLQNVTAKEISQIIFAK